MKNRDYSIEFYAIAMALLVIIVLIQK